MDQLQYMTGILQQIRRVCVETRDEEAALRKIRQLAGFALERVPPDEQEQVAAMSVGARLLAEAEQNVRAEDVAEARQEAEALHALGWTP